MDETPVDVSIASLMKNPRQRLKAAGLTNSPIETGHGLGYRLKSAPVKRVEIEVNSGKPENSTVELGSATLRLDLVMQ